MKKWIKNHPRWRAVGAFCLIAGALLMWLAPEIVYGAIPFVAGVVLEAAGIALEHRDRQS